MTEPRRLIEDAGFAGELLRSAAADEPHAQALGQALKVAASAGAAGAGVATGASIAPVAAKKSMTSWLLLKWLSIGALAGGATVATAEVWVAAFEPSVRHTASAAPAVSAASVGTTEVVAPAVSTTPRQTNARPTAVPVPAAPSKRRDAAAVEDVPDVVENPPSGSGVAAFDPLPASRPSLAEEQRVLERARRSLRQGQPDRALMNLRSYWRMFPKPRFAQEASLIRLESLVSVGRCGEAATEAKRFSGAHANSALRRRAESVLRSCGR